MKRPLFLREHPALGAGTLRTPSRLCGWVIATALAASAASSCGDQPGARIQVAPGSASDDDSTGAGFQVDDPGLTPAEDQDRQCLNQSREALPIGLDIYVMLDTSQSMKDLLPQDSANPNQDKWTAVRKSIEAFVAAPDTRDIGIGLQYFPQVLADVPFTCSDNTDCGSAGGACSNSRCVKSGTGTLPGNYEVSILVDTGDDTPCEDDDECSGAGQTCVSLLGQCVVRPGDIEFPDGSLLPAKVPALCATSDDCSSIPGAVCEELGQCQNVVGGTRPSCTRSIPCPTGGGQCNRPTHTCSNQTLCKVENYAAPAVPISSAAGRADAIRASLDAVDPVGPTPTGPALQGALQQARDWAAEHSDRQVVTVLVTDGFPTDCSPIANAEVAAIAKNANASSDPIHTFVVGVFSTQDLGADGEARLNELARAGGSEKAFVINTADDVTQGLLDALNEIRDSSSRCNFPLDSTELDLNKVNLEVIDSSGTTTPLFNVGTPADCGSDQQGWFYENRDGGGRQITVCPRTCRDFLAGVVQADLQIGCATRIR
ncbi:MAG TPA: vWA domain-containing protein [Polyangiaceae bacterium]|nr:vWA domain-containing protein [Polyangiaceae bacterium]